MTSRTVLVTAARRTDDQGVERVRLNTAYVTSLENAGLVPLLMPPLSDSARAAEALESMAGLVLTGGGDLDPELYGETARPESHPPQKDRDLTELALTTAARERGVPVLAICRGLQVLNVALGGTLIQDIPVEQPDALDHNGTGPRDLRSHEVDITPGSRLAKAVGATRINVNSFHHQAVGRVAPGLEVTARSSDGIIEGLESGDDWWALAVQWHPEEMDHAREAWDRGLFRAFASALAARR